MNQEVLEEFADQLGADSEAILERWQGRPDNIIDDIFRVRDIDTGEVRDLELFDVQRKVVHAYFYGDAGTLNTYKGRRIGYSFIFCACFLLEGMFYPNSYYPLVSRSLGQAKDRIEDIQNLIDHAKIEIPTNKDNTDYIELWNDTAFKAFSADSDVSRGDRSGRAVLLDEMAFIEDEKRTMRAFGAFLALGENRKMVEVSTPNTLNDLFMQEHERGSPDGEDGVISIKQPTFHNADEIDVNISLYDQELEPVRPDINIDRVETDRLADPTGFGQEYLCRPVVDEYRFFSEKTIDEAMQKMHRDDYYVGIDAPKFTGARRIMGIDIAAGVEGGDDTVISVMDHNKGERYQKFIEIVDEDSLSELNVSDPDPNDVVQVARYISTVYNQMEVDGAILDKGGVGQTFERQIERQLGRRVVGFDFSDTEAVNDMFEDTNICLRQGEIVLIDNERLEDELKSIVKQKKEDYSTPRYSGKDNSKSGKDDAAMATVLSAFPPKMSDPVATSPSAKQTTSPEEYYLARREQDPMEAESVSHGAVTVTRTKRSRSNRHQSRYSRHR